MPESPDTSEPTFQKSWIRPYGQNIGPDLDPSWLFDTLMVFLKDFFEMLILKKKNAKLPSLHSLNNCI